MAASFVTFVLLSVSGILSPIDPEEGAILMVVTTLVTTAVWVAVTFATEPTPDATLHAFYRRVRPGGPGWRAVADQLGFGPEPIAAGSLSWLNWIAGVVSVYATLFGIGKLIFGSPFVAIAYLVVAAAAFAWIAYSLKRERIWREPEQRPPLAPTPMREVVGG